MLCLVYVKFLPGGSLSPDEFFARVNARWRWLEEEKVQTTPRVGFEIKVRPRSALCITDYDSIQQLAIDLAIMPGAGISSVEVVPVDEVTEQEALAGQLAVYEAPLRDSDW